MSMPAFNAPRSSPPTPEKTLSPGIAIRLVTLALLWPNNREQGNHAGFRAGERNCPLRFQPSKRQRWYQSANDTASILVPSSRNMK